MKIPVRKRELFLWTAIAVLVVIFAGTVSLFGSIWYAFDRYAACCDEILSSTRSPDRTKAVLVFRQECNATVPDSVWATIAPADQIVSVDRNNTFLGIVGHAEVLPTWRGNDVVEIALLPGNSDVIRREASYAKIRIDYK